MKISPYITFPPAHAQVLLRRLKKEETILKELQDSLAPLRGQLDQIKYERSEIESEKRAKIKDVEALTAENKAFRAEVLKADSLTRDAQGAVSGANQEASAFLLHYYCFLGGGIELVDDFFCMQCQISSFVNLFVEIRVLRPVVYRKKFLIPLPQI